MALTQYLRNYFLPDRICPVDEWEALINLDREELGRYQLFAGHFRLSIQTYLAQTPLYITMLRHPVEQTVSMFYYIQAHPEHRLWRKMSSMSLLEYLHDPETKEVAGNFQTKYLVGIWDTPEPDHLLQTARRHLTGYAFVGIAERFTASILLLGSLFGWEPSPYAHVNVNPNRPRREALPPEVVAEILACNQVDMELYAYAQARLDQDLARLDSPYLLQTILSMLEKYSVQHGAQTEAGAEIERLQHQVSSLTDQLWTSRYIAEVASQEVDNLHNGRVYRLANWYWQWRDRFRKLLNNR